MQPNPRADTSNPSEPSFTLGTVGRIPDLADAMIHTQETQARIAALLNNSTSDQKNFRVTKQSSIPNLKFKFGTKLMHTAKWSNWCTKVRKPKKKLFTKQKCKAATSGRTLNPEPPALQFKMPT
jgi:hypothetical protein